MLNLISIFVLLLVVFHLSFVAVDTTGDPATRGQGGRQERSHFGETFSRCLFEEHGSACPDDDDLGEFPGSVPQIGEIFDAELKDLNVEDLVNARFRQIFGVDEEEFFNIEDVPIPEIGETSEGDEAEDLNIENLLKALRNATPSDGFYIPYYYPDYNDTQTGANATFVRYSRKPFDDPAIYAVVDEDPRGYNGYHQVPCDCHHNRCENLKYEDLQHKKWDLRVQELCFVKERELSLPMRRRVARRKRCQPHNNCYGDGAKSSTEARCPVFGGRRILKTGLTIAEKNTLLFYHNFVRALRAEGTDVGSIISFKRQVANMLEMEWDPTLADQAQRLANTCGFSYTCSYCFGRAYVDPVGQIFLHLRQGDPDYMKYMATFLLKISQLLEEDVQSFTGADGTGMHGQLLWADTSRVGCGLVQSNIGRRVDTFLVCNYFPSGNRVGKPVFVEGPACSLCPPKYSCSLHSKVLCSRFNATIAANATAEMREEAEQFFAVTDEEKRRRRRIVWQVLSKANRNLARFDKRGRLLPSGMSADRF